jgi:LPS-assembly protein
VLSGAHLGYEVQLAVRRTDVVCSGTTRSRDAGGLLDQRADLVWDSPCHCFTAGVKLSQDACGDFHYSFLLDLSRLMQGSGTR